MIGFRFYDVYYDAGYPQSSYGDVMSINLGITYLTDFVDNGIRHSKSREWQEQKPIRKAEKAQQSSQAKPKGDKKTDVPGILIITGIPKEFEGKFLASPRMINFEGRTRGSRAKTNEAVAITNGEVSLSVFEDRGGKPRGYAGNDGLDVRISIQDAKDSSFDIAGFILPAVQFEDGFARTAWTNVASAGWITVTNIPEEYRVGGGADILIGQRRYGLGPRGVPHGRGLIRRDNGMAVVPIFPSRTESGFVSYNESTTRDILLVLSPPRGGHVHEFLFTRVQIKDGKATIDFRQGVRQ